MRKVNRKWLEKRAKGVCFYSLIFTQNYKRKSKMWEVVCISISERSFTAITGTSQYSQFTTLPKWCHNNFCKEEWKRSKYLPIKDQKNGNNVWMLSIRYKQTIQSTHTFLHINILYIRWTIKFLGVRNFNRMMKIIRK